jgi:hypothetical protein
MNLKLAYSRGFWFMVKRSALAKATAVGVLAVLLIAGAVEIYYYTSAPAGKTAIKSTSSSAGASSSTSQSGNAMSASGPSGACVMNAQGLCTDGGSCATNAQGQCVQPLGAWADYLGYIPAGYILAPHLPNALTYPCPSGMDATQCATFQQSCGNGVCDPNESCATCPIECRVSSGLTCNPYTGRAGASVSVCQFTGVQ